VILADCGFEVRRFLDTALSGTAWRNLVTNAFENPKAFVIAADHDE
jgi:hypothetical protein